MSYRGHPSLPYRWFVSWGPAVCLMVAIYLVSESSYPPRLLVSVSDVAAHAVAYAALAAAMLRGLAGARRSGVTVGTVILAVALATAYGVADEIHQSYVPGRSPELRDVAVDALGATAGAVAGWAWYVVPAVRSGRQSD